MGDKKQLNQKKDGRREVIIKGLFIAFHPAIKKGGHVCFDPVAVGIKTVELNSYKHPPPPPPFHSHLTPEFGVPSKPQCSAFSMSHFAALLSHFQSA